MFGQAEAALYDRSLDEAVRYIVGIAQSLPRFEVQAAATALGRLSRIGGDLEKVLDGIARIERLVQHTDPGETTRRYEADYRQAVQRNLDYLELFGADISPEAQRHSLRVGYVSLNLTSGINQNTGLGTHSADSLIWLLGAGSGRMLLRGHAGSGKSTLLRWLAIVTASGRAVPTLETTRNWLIHMASHGKTLLIENICKGDTTVFDHWESATYSTDFTEAFTNLKENVSLTTYFRSSSDENWKEFREGLWSNWFVPRVPFLIRLRDCNNGRLPTPDDLPALIANELGRPPADWVKSVLDAGNGLLLLDGVDEVPDQQRETTRHNLESLIAHYPQNQFVVTTRPAAVPEGWLASAGFTEASINPMSPPDRAEFIRRWHAAVSEELIRQGRPADLSSLGDELIAKLLESPAIARLATNPLLCAALCALHRDRHRKLPESQSELCEALCQLLLHRREIYAGLQLSEFPREYRELTYEQKRAIVQAIAHYMVRNDDSVIAETDAFAVTRDALRGFPSGREADAPMVLRALIERSGVLREQRPGAIDFVHNTIKEFLAAEMFVAGRDVSTLARRALDDFWRQVVLFASATRDRKFATRLVTRILELADEASDSDLARRLRLAAVSCRYAALHMEPEAVASLSVVERTLVPPRTMNDAEALAGSADNVVPLLRFRRMQAREAAACVRTLRLIGTDAAKRVLDGYIGDRRQAVVAELVQAINPLRLAAIREKLTRGEAVPREISRQITDLSPLSEINHPEQLNLQGAAITDFRPLSKLAKLRSLNLKYTPIKSLTQLSSLSKLEDLDISHTAINDLEPLREMSALCKLAMAATPVREVTALSELGRLKTLNLAHSEVSDLESLASLTQLGRNGCF
jgi:NACHT domain-containing protein/NACHT conflict system protein